MRERIQHPARTRRLLAACALAAAAVALSASGVATAATAPAASPGARQVMFVGNNWEGTADIVDMQSFTKLARIDVVPDLGERLMEIYTNPVDLGYFLAIRQLVGEGNDQFVDDMFSSNDGRFVYVSRPSLKDVVGIDLASGEIVWRIEVDGQRADHMAISPDGSRLLVSASTANKVHVIDPRSGELIGEFESGDSPHENSFSKDGKRIFHASIGLVYTPADQPILDSTKGDRWFQVVNAETLEIEKRLDIGQILDAHGYPDMSSAVRPMAISPDERYFYLQLSFLHGFVEFDLETETPLRVASLPVSEQAKQLRREDYLLDSAHHGLTINTEGTKLCVAGTMSDYGAIVQRSSFAYKLFDVGRKPYWATNSADGKQCWLSSSGDDQVVVLDYAGEREVGRVPVGDHPQRVRAGAIRREYIGELAPAEGAPPTLELRCLPKGRLRMVVNDPDNLVSHVDFKLGKQRIAKRDSTRPFRRRMSSRLLARTRRTQLRAVVYRGDERIQVLTARLPRCA